MFVALMSILTQTMIKSESDLILIVSVHIFKPTGRLAFVQLADANP